MDLLTLLDAEFPTFTNTTTPSFFAPQLFLQQHQHFQPQQPYYPSFMISTPSDTSLPPTKPSLPVTLTDPQQPQPFKFYLPNQFLPSASVILPPTSAQTIPTNMVFPSTTTTTTADSQHRRTESLGSETAVSETPSLWEDPLAPSPVLSLKAFEGLGMGMEEEPYVEKYEDVEEEEEEEEGGVEVEEEDGDDEEYVPVSPKQSKRAFKRTVGKKSKKSCSPLKSPSSSVPSSPALSVSSLTSCPSASSFSAPNSPTNTTFPPSETNTTTTTTTTTIQGEKWFKCPYTGCPRVFNRRGNLRSHAISHSEVKAYTCAHCPAAFSRSHDLQRHTRAIHTKERPHKCGNCPAAFARADALKKHLVFEAKKRRAAGQAA
ncbi:hypothetical protein HDV05_005252 [Chytridiales sp. JEL 0842]|nr:hypothetical protein HDV05_005252 [Chytridiales sp. JEL 0842]